MVNKLVRTLEQENFYYFNFFTSLEKEKNTNIGGPSQQAPLDDAIK